MKKTNHRKERGQALILIVLAIVGLIGITGLAVDGGNAYAERRHAQNAADTTALDAALAKVRNGNLYTEGLARAASNSYVDTDYGVNSSDPDVNVEIYNPPTDGPYSCASIDPSLDCNEYIQVKITATIPTYFGRVLGIPTITNQVEAVARGKPSEIFPIAFGNAIVGLSSECQAIVVQGNGDSVLTGGGIYANGVDCTHSTAFFNNSGSATMDTPCLQAVGGYTMTNNINTHGCTASGDSVPVLPGIVYPNPSCSGAGSSTATADGATLSPGTYSGEFPPVSGNPNQTITLQPGVYCVDEFDVNSQTEVIGTDVVIVVDGDININGGAGVTLSAPTEGVYEGLLFYVPEGTNGDVTINGDSTVNMTGTVLAPTSDVTLNGAAGSTFAWSSQIVGWNVTVTGGADMTINYNSNDNYRAPVYPQVELIQ